MAAKHKKTKKKKVVIRQDVKFISAVTESLLNEKASRAIRKINRKGGEVQLAKYDTAPYRASILFKK